VRKEIAMRPQTVRTRVWVGLLVVTVLLLRPLFAQPRREATKVGLSGVCCLTLDDQGNLYFIEFHEHRVSKVTPGGELVTVAGTGKSGYKGDGGPAVAAQLNQPVDVVADATGNVYISDAGNNRVRRVGTDGIIATVAGNGQKPAKDGEFPNVIPAVGTAISPGGLAVDASSQLYVYVSRGLWRLRDGNLTKLTDDEVVQLLSGARGSQARDASGNRWSAHAFYPQSKPGRLSFRRVILKTNPRGEETIVAGNGKRGPSPGRDPVDATSIGLVNPLGVAVGPDGTAYISDINNVAILKLTPGGKISVVYSTPLNAPIAVYLASPAGITVDRSGNVYFAAPDGSPNFSSQGVVGNIARGYLMLRTDEGEPLMLSGRVINSKIYKMTPDGVTTLIAGK
jgi:hypothetical protein